MALATGPVSREKLADLLWGDSPDGLARQSLRQCLVVTRKVLDAISPDLLVTTSDTVQLRGDLISVDVSDFLRLAETRDPQGAADVYAGQFLDGIGLESVPIAEWISGRRTYLAAVAARVLQLTAEMWDMRGDGRRAISAAERLIEVDCFREDWQRTVLRLYARYLGRQHALGHAKKLTTTLRRELDADPEPATLQLIARIRTGWSNPKCRFVAQSTEYSI